MRSSESSAQVYDVSVQSDRIRGSYQMMYPKTFVASLLQRCEPLRLIRGFGVLQHTVQIAQNRYCL